jgi:hypothetical protein
VIFVVVSPILEGDEEELKGSDRASLKGSDFDGNLK